MKTFLYKILDSNNNCLYIGHSLNPKLRFNCHIKNPGKGSKIFLGRTDLHYEIIESIERENAWEREYDLQKEYKLETDREHIEDGMRKGFQKMSEDNKIKHRQNIQKMWDNMDPLEKERRSLLIKNRWKKLTSEEKQNIVEKRLSTIRQKKTAPGKSKSSNSETS